jgi:hypothetical protein
MQSQNRSLHLAEKLKPRVDISQLREDWDFGEPDADGLPSLTMAALMLIGLLMLAIGLLGGAWFVVSGLLLLGS